jgi:CheY-like chemotaxis protein
MSGPAPAPAADILLVEDNPGDVRLIREALADRGAGHRLHHVANGEEAIAFVRHRGTYTGAPRPDLILLDLNLPRKDGREVLAELKSDPDLRLIPVIVLTTSRAERDIAQAYELEANSYISKPIDFDGFLGAVQEIEDFWLTIARLPS